ncbi:MAG: TonB-dependent receptor [Acidobacteria bacterium]|nr:TonB-dependent receptor [Acidobacteriota bacterium]
MLARVGIVGVGLVLCLLLLPSAASAQAIGGTVTDETGGVLPGVTIEVRSPALIEQVRTAISDGSGQYLITGLVSGEYSVSFGLPGFSTILREGIVLSAGFQANVDAQLAVGSVEETITVTGAAPTVDVSTVQQNTAIDRDIIDTIPSGKSFQNLAILIPGMVGDGVVGSTLAVDVGGQGGVNYQRLAIHGGESQDQMVQIDGMGVEAVTRQGDSSNMFFADGNYSEYSIDYSGNSAEIESSGVRINMIPRDGGNDWAGHFFTSFSTPDLQSNNVSDELVTRGIGKDQANRLSKLWFVNPAFGGPIVRDRLWFWASHTSQRTDQYVANVFFDANPSDLLYTPTDEQAIDDQLAQSTTVRLTAQATPRNKLTFFYDNNYNKRNRFLIGSTLSSTLNVMPEAAVDSTIKVQVYQGTWTAPITNRLLIQAGVSLHPQHQNWKNTPDADISLPGALLIPGNRAIRGMSSWFSGTIFQDRYADTNAARASVSYVTGSHAFKFGMNLTTVAEDQYTESVQYQRIISLARFISPVDLVDFYATPALEENNFPANLGLYAQDQWTLDRLTLNLGVRWDYFNAAYPDHETGTSLYRPTSFSFEGQQVVGFKDIQPRLGMAYDLFGDGRTALKASFGRYADRDSNTRSADINPAASNIEQRRAFLDLNQNGLADCDPLNAAPNGECFTPSDNLAFGLPVISTFYDQDWAFGWGTRHANYESSVSVQHELANNVSLDVGWFHRSFVNFEVVDNRAVGRDDYSTFSVTVPTDNRIPGGGGNTLAGFYDINPDKLGQIDNITTGATAFGDRSRSYRGFDVALDARLDNLLLRGGISTGETSFDNCDLISNLPEAQEVGISEYDGDYISAPFCNFGSGYLTQVKLLGSYTFPYDIVFAGTLQSIPGPERGAIVTYSSADVAASLGRPLSGGGTIDINIVEPGSAYGDRLNQVDLRLSKVFNFSGSRFQIMFDVYNLLNENSVTEEDLNYGPAYLSPIAIMPGRLAKFAFQYNF